MKIINYFTIQLIFAIIYELTRILGTIHDPTVLFLLTFIFIYLYFQ